MRIRVVTVKPYRVHNFVWDASLTAVTGGFWGIWIFVREMRRHG